MMIRLTHLEWHDIRKRIRAEYPPSTLMIRSTTREVLGFTPRNHSHYDPSLGRYLNEVHLDFYDEAKEIWFRLKYL